MKVLLDENPPHGMRAALPGHDVFTARHLGWEGIRNGVLLGKAEESGFKVLLTADQSISYQQSITGRTLGLVVLNTNSWPRIQPRMAAIADALGQSCPGFVVYVEV